MKTFLANPTSSEVVALVEALYVANHYKKRTQVRRNDNKFIISFAGESTAGEFVSSTDPNS